MQRRILMFFIYKNGWRVTFFDNDRYCTKLRRTAFFNSSDTMAEFARRAGGLRTLEERNIFDMQVQRNCGEIEIDPTPEQYATLRK